MNGTAEIKTVGICDVCESGKTMPARYHGLDCPKRNSARKRVVSPKLSEAHIERTCTDFLALDGWRGLKTTPVSNRGRACGFGELGMADYLYIRYNEGQIRFPDRSLTSRAYTIEKIMWIEWKHKGKKSQAHQIAWHQAERARGALVFAAGTDFPQSIEGFQAWYRASGLMRRKI